MNKVTKEQVDNNMKNVLVETNYSFGKPITRVTVEMENGFLLTETSSCVDPLCYDEKIGAEICLKKIEDKIWYLLGYALQDKVYRESLAPTVNLATSVNDKLYITDPSKVKIGKYDMTLEQIIDKVMEKEPETTPNNKINTFRPPFGDVLYRSDYK